nr:hypothetical protein [Sphaerotilus sp.]
MSAFIALGPDQEDNPTLPVAQALKPKLAVAGAGIFHRDHRRVKDAFQFREINSVLADVRAALGFVPSDHDKNVDAF